MVKNSGERFVATIIMIIGVLFFSVLSSSILSLFQNNDEEYKNLEIFLKILDRIQSKYKLPVDLYTLLLIEAKYSVKNDEKDINYFIDNLPIKIKNKVT